MITKIGEYNYALQVAFEENVEKPIEEQEEKREKAIEKSQEHIEELNRTIENMEDFSRKAKADKSAIEGGVKEAQKMANIYEDFKRQKLMDQKLTMERLQKQRNKIMRDSF